jgi:hypothetical protein
MEEKRMRRSRHSASVCGRNAELTEVMRDDAMRSTTCAKMAEAQ